MDSMNEPRRATMTPPSGYPIMTSDGVSWLALEPEPASAKRARDHINRLLDGDDKPFVGDVLVVVDELVTNAIRHAPERFVVAAGVSPRIHLSLQSRRRWVRIGVRDPWPGLPRARGSQDLAEYGRGLAIVDALAAGRWTDTGSHEKTVHALIPRPGHVITEAQMKRLRRP